MLYAVVAIDFWFTGIFFQKQGVFDKISSFKIYIPLNENLPQKNSQ
jgi:hypothetical protein